jgi:hypothetical protein
LSGGPDGVAEWNAFRSGAQQLVLDKLDLHDTVVDGANLARTRIRGRWERVQFHNADFSSSTLFASMQQCHFWRSHFERASVFGSILNDVRFVECGLKKSYWFDSRFNEVSFAECVMRESGFDGLVARSVAWTSTDLTSSRFGNCSLSGVLVDGSLLCDIDLTPFIDAVTPVAAAHAFAAVVDWKSVAKSRHVARMIDLLIALGMPAVVAIYLIESVNSLSIPELFSMLQSTFISYGGPDQEFAQRLHEGLQKNGVHTFFFPEHAEMGRRLSSVMNKGVGEFDRTVLVCSKASLSRAGVRNEIQLALDREAREGGSDRLIPIALDDYVFTAEWWPERPENVRAVRDKVVADFRDLDKFDRQLTRLIAALKKHHLPNGGKGSSPLTT